MDIVEFQKRWIMRYINPIFFYLPFQSCQVNEIGFYIKVLLWNTYNPVKDEYKNRLTEKGRLINRPCDYYKILITYLGDESKDDKTRREELVYCSSLNNMDSRNICRAQATRQFRNLGEHHGKTKKG